MESDDILAGLNKIEALLNQTIFIVRIDIIYDANHQPQIHICEVTKIVAAPKDNMLSKSLNGSVYLQHNNDNVGYDRFSLTSPSLELIYRTLKLPMRMKRVNGVDYKAQFDSIGNTVYYVQGCTMSHLDSKTFDNLTDNIIQNIKNAKQDIVMYEGEENEETNEEDKKEDDILKGLEAAEQYISNARVQINVQFYSSIREPGQANISLVTRNLLFINDKQWADVHFDYTYRKRPNDVYSVFLYDHGTRVTNFEYRGVGKDIDTVCKDLMLYINQYNKKISDKNRHINLDYDTLINAVKAVPERIKTFGDAPEIDEDFP